MNLTLASVGVTILQGGFTMHWRLIDKNEEDRFDHFVSTAQAGDIMQSYAWGEIKGLDWHAYRGVVEDESGRITAAASLLVRNIPFFGRTIAYAPRGPVLTDYNNTGLLRFVLSKLTELAREKKAIMLKLDPAVPNDQVMPAGTLQEMGFRRPREKHDFGGLQPRYTFRLLLTGPIEDIFSRFSKKVRYKMNYAPKIGLVFRKNEQTCIGDFYKVLAQTGERSGFFTRSPEYFQRVYNILKEKDRILLLTGYLAEEPVVSSLTFVFGDKSWAVYGGQKQQHRNLYAYHAMNWERIRWAHGRGASWFDFYGVPGHVEESHPLYGLYHFKKSFGGDFVAFTGEWDLPLSLTLYLLWDSALPRYRQLKHRLRKAFMK
jgi:lipid II:glycine glycyltransferase (peptidoglycan interpeptide bridge formation enzyme)